MDDDIVPRELGVFFENSPIALALARADADNELILVNRGFRDLTGYAPADVVGQNCRLLQRDAHNDESRAKLRIFLAKEQAASVRTTIINFKKDGTPFVNLLYMSRLRSLGGQTRYIFASQFDVSRAHPDRIHEYDATLGSVLTRLSPVAAESGIIVEGSLTTIANSANIIAQAKLTLADLDSSSFL